MVTNFSANDIPIERGRKQLVQKKVTLKYRLVSVKACNYL